MVNLILDMFPDRVNSQGKQHIFTPHEVAEDMIHKIPNGEFIYGNTFLDPYCKSGVFLENIYQRLMQSPDLVSRFSDRFERHKYILKNQIFGISPTEECRAISIRTVYGDINVANNIICLGNKYLDIIKNKDKQFLCKLLEREFGRVKFNVVALNPPYNKGIDIDFINKAYDLSTDYVIAITPAKWQTAEADQKISSNMSYGEFREKIVPHMSYVCFYPNCSDVFNIQERSGITYFLLEKTNNTDICTVENKSSYQPLLNSVHRRKITNAESLLNIVNMVIDYLGNYKSFKFVDTQGEYAVNIGKCIRNERGKKDMYQALGIISYNTGKASVLENTEIIKRIDNKFKTTIENSEIIFQDNDIKKCESFESWLTSKFVRFFLLGNISTRSDIFNDNYFRFVPAPPSGKFDHIYTDEELYKTFNLPQEYIDIIEAIIKERK